MTAARTYICSQEPHPGREFYGDFGCGECGYVPDPEAGGREATPAPRSTGTGTGGVS